MANDTNIVTLTAADAVNIEWEKCFSKTIVGVKISACISIAVVGQKIRITFTLSIGSLNKSWVFDVTGNFCFNFPLGGATASICISNWQITTHSISFTLTFTLKAFGFKIFSFSQNITLPIQGADDLDALFAAVDSPESFLSFLKLLAALEGDGDEVDDDDSGRSLECYQHPHCSGKMIGKVATCAQCHHEGGASVKNSKGKCKNCRK